MKIYLRCNSHSIRKCGNFCNWKIRYKGRESGELSQTTTQLYTHRKEISLGFNVKSECIHLLRILKASLLCSKYNQLVNATMGGRNMQFLVYPIFRISIFQFYHLKKKTLHSTYTMRSLYLLFADEQKMNALLLICCLLLNSLSLLPAYYTASRNLIKALQVSRTQLALTTADFKNGLTFEIGRFYNAFSNSILKYLKMVSR